MFIGGKRSMLQQSDNNNHIHKLTDKPSTQSQVLHCTQVHKYTVHKC